MIEDMLRMVQLPTGTERLFKSLGFGILFLLCLSFVSATQYDETFDIQQSDTFKKVTEETYTVSYVDNETGETITEERTRTTKETTDLIDIRDISIERVGNSKSDEPAKKVRTRIEIFPSELGQRIIGNDDVSMYEMNGEPITQQEKQTLKREMSDLSISYEIGNSGKMKGRPINAKNGKTYNIVSNLQDGKAKFDIGSRTTTITINSQQQFENGTYTRTSTDRDDNSGELGLGYTYAQNSYSWLPQNNDVVAQWEFTDNFGSSSSGDTVSDRSGSGNSGTTQSDVDTTASGVFSTGAYDFDGTNDYITTPIKPDVDLDESTGITFSVWAFHRSFVSSGSALYTGVNDGSGSRRLLQFGNTNFGTNTIDFITYDGSTNEGVTYPVSNLNTNTWYHIVGVYDPTNGYKLYVDGVEVANDTSTTWYGDSDDFDLWVGTLNANGGVNQNIFDGKLSNFLIYNSSLTKSEIERLYINGGNGTFNGTYGSDNLRSGNSTSTGWDEFNVTTNGNNQDVNATVEVSDDNFSTVLDSTTITSITDGQNSFDISSLQNADDVRVHYDFTSSDETQTAEVTSYSISTSQPTPSQPNITVSQSVSNTWTLGNETVSHTINATDVSDVSWNITINDVLMRDGIELGTDFNTVIKETYNVTNTTITSQTTGNSVSVQSSNTYTFSAYDQGSTENDTTTTPFSVDDGSQPSTSFTTPTQEQILLLFVMMGIGISIWFLGNGLIYSLIGGFFIFTTTIYIHVEDMFYDTFTPLYVILGLFFWAWTVFEDIE